MEYILSDGDIGMVFFVIWRVSQIWRGTVLILIIYRSNKCPKYFYEHGPKPTFRDSYWWMQGFQSFLYSRCRSKDYAWILEMSFEWAIYVLIDVLIKLYSAKILFGTLWYVFILSLAKYSLTCNLTLRYNYCSWIYCLFLAHINRTEKHRPKLRRSWDLLTADTGPEDSSLLKKRQSSNIPAYALQRSIDLVLGICGRVLAGSYRLLWIGLPGADNLYSLTCKQRKLKCDEKKPLCGPCSRTSRSCRYANGPEFRHFGGSRASPSDDEEPGPSFLEDQVWLDIPRERISMHRYSCW